MSNIRPKVGEEGREVENEEEWREVENEEGWREVENEEEWREVENEEGWVVEKNDAEDKEGLSRVFKNCFLKMTEDIFVDDDAGGDVDTAEQLLYSGDIRSSV